MKKIDAFLSKYLVLFSEIALVVLLSSKILVEIFSPGAEGSIEPVNLKWRTASSLAQLVDERYTLPENSFGFRDCEYSRTKGKGTFRIIVLGNENSFGLGVKLQDVYPKILEKMLRDRMPSKHIKRYEVLNFGRIGDTLGKETERFVKEGASFNPDALIISYFPGDLAESPESFSRRFKGSKNLLEVVFSPQDYIYDYPMLKWSRTYRYFYARHAYGRVMRSYCEYIKGLYEANRWGKAGKNLETVIKYAQARNIKVMAVLVPLCFRLDDYPLKGIDSLLAGFFEGEGVSAVSLLGTYSKHKTRSLCLTSTTFFPNEFARRLAAEAVFEALVPKKSIK
jgi:hypothetical protein